MQLKRFELGSMVFSESGNHNLILYEIADWVAPYSSSELLWVMPRISQFVGLDVGVCVVGKMGQGCG